HQLDEVGELRLVGVEGSLGGLLRHPNDEVREVPAEVLQQGLDDGQVEHRLVLRPELLEAGIVVETIVQEVEVCRRPGAEGLEEMEVGEALVDVESACPR